MAVGIFISYNRLDYAIASELRSCLVALSDSLHVFIDHASIDPGEDYDRRIAESINESVWFIMINPGSPSASKDMGWCIYEAGQFRNRLAAQSRTDKAIVEKMCVVYDRAIPSPLSRYKGICVQGRTPDNERLDLTADSSRIEKTPVFQLFTAILERSNGVPIRPTSEPDIRQLIRDQARRFIKSYLAGLTDEPGPEVPLQPRISLMLPPPPEAGMTKVDAATVVTGWEKALPEVFGIAGDQTTWGQIEAAFKLPSKANALWLQDLEEALIAVSADKVPAQSNMLVHAKNGSLYRAVVTRYFPFLTGRREVFISFTQAPRRSLIPGQALAIVPKQQILLISLLFAFRFRQQVLPLAYKARTLSADTKKLRPVLMQLEREIMVLENEAQEYGFDLSEEHLDHPQLNDSITDAADQELVTRITVQWAQLRNQLMTSLSDMRNPETGTCAADVPCEFIEGLAAMAEPNKRFTEIVVRELVRSQDLDLTRKERVVRPVGLAGSSLVAG